MALKGIQNIDLESAGSATEVTKTQLDTLVTNSTLVPGTLYKIGVHPELYNDGVTNLTTILIRAATTNKLELQGHGLFYTPKYSQPDANMGIWTATGVVYATGNKTAWGGYMWNNLTGAVGSATNRKTLDATNWAKLPFTTTDYNLAVDTIHYEYSSDNIVMREDAIGNVVFASSIHNTAMQGGYGLTAISAFQWGNKPTGLYTSGTFNNKIYDSFFEGINLKGVINNNELREWCTFVGNTVAKDGEFTFNIVENRCTIQNNTIGTLTGITDNFLYFYSTINTNTLGASSYGIRHNRLYSQSTMNSNTFIAGVSAAGLRQNTLDIVSSINSNTMNFASTIYMNSLTSSTINSNVMSSISTGQNAYIYKNTLSDAAINSNQINGTIAGNMPGITGNSLKGSNFSGAHLFPATISNNNLQGDSRVEGNTLRNSTIQNLLTLADVKGFDLNNFVLDFSNIILSTSLLNAKADANSLEYIFSKTFVGGTGGGSVGEISIPHMPVPIGFFFEEVLVRVDTTLVETANANFNLGMSIDGYSTGLGGATGDVGTLNTNVITKYILGTSGYTRASVLQRIYLEVGGASVTSGAVTIIVRLAKIS